MNDKARLSHKLNRKRNKIYRKRINRKGQLEKGK